MGILLDSTSFWDVVWWMLMVFVWTMVLWMFIAIFGDIFRRRDLSGFAKAGWIFVIFILPLLGILIYMIARPKPTAEEMREMQRMSGYGSAAGPMTSTDDIAKAHTLLQQGALTQEEFDEIKRRAIG